MINVFLWVAVMRCKSFDGLDALQSDTVVVSTMIWSMWQNGRTADAAVLGVVLIFLSAVLLACGQIVSIMRRGAHS